MVGTRKSSGGKATATIDGSSIVEYVDEDDGAGDIIRQFSVGFLSFQFSSHID